MYMLIPLYFFCGGIIASLSGMDGVTEGIVCGFLWPVFVCVACGFLLVEYIRDRL